MRENPTEPPRGASFSTMNRRRAAALLLTSACALQTLLAQAPDAAQAAQERAQAELDAPKLMKVLSVTPGMTVADIGAGFGAMSVVLGKWIGPGRIYATDIGERQLGVIREAVQREGLANVAVILGAADATNLPDSCCDAIFLRHVYHHVVAVAAFNRSVYASLKPGGRVAIIDFVPTAGSKLPAGVLANRGGHGIPPAVVIEELAAAGFTHETTIDKWPPGDKQPSYFLTLFKK
jgi:predicted methyltransferase